MKLGISKIFYKKGDADDTFPWIELPTLHLSGELNIDYKKEPAGRLVTTELTADITANATATIADTLLALLSEWYQFKVTAINGAEYLLGSELYRPAFSYTQHIGGLKALNYEIQIFYTGTDEIRIK